MEESLCAAAQQGNLEEVRRLVRQGANVNDSRGRTALHCASGNGHRDVALFLVQNCANVNSVDNYWQQTPLHWACKNGHVQVAQLLLQNGAEVNSVDDYWQQTPLHLACRHGYSKVAQLLLNSGARTCARTKDGRTPLDEAAHYGYTDVVDLSKNHDQKEKANDTVGGAIPPMNEKAFGADSGNQEADISNALLAAADAVVASDRSDTDAVGNVPRFSSHPGQSLNAVYRRNSNHQYSYAQEQQQEQPAMSAWNKPAVLSLRTMKTDWNSQAYRDRHPLRLKDELNDEELLHHCKSFLTHLAKHRCKQPAGSSQRVNDCRCVHLCLVSKAKKPRALLATARFMVHYGRMKKDEQNKLVVPEIAKAMESNKKHRKTQLTGLSFPLPNRPNICKPSKKPSRAADFSYPQTVCKSAFLRILDIGDTRFRDLRKHAKNGTLPVHGLKRKNSKSSGEMPGGDASRKKQK